MQLEPRKYVTELSNRSTKGRRLEVRVGHEMFDGALRARVTGYRGRP
jgi:hypothetical protein